MKILNNIIKIKLIEIILNLKKKNFIKLLKNIKYYKKINLNRNFYNKIINYNIIYKKFPIIISEIKNSSPSKGIFKLNFNKIRFSLNYEKYNAICISILTDKLFFNSFFKNLIKIKYFINLPLICKDFVINKYQIFLMYYWGADNILLIKSIFKNNNYFNNLYNYALKLNVNILIEIHNLYEIKKNILKKKKILIGINNRNLYNFITSIKNTLILKSFLNIKKIFITESGINNINDIILIQNYNINIFLIGENLIKSKNLKFKFFDLIKFC